jgi:hypothetical protein
VDVEAGFGVGRSLLVGNGLLRSWGRVAGVVGVGGPCFLVEDLRGGRLDRELDGRGWIVVRRPYSGEEEAQEWVWVNVEMVVDVSCSSESRTAPPIVEG